jgi:predicted RNase H-like HicB family nuclease
MVIEWSDEDGLFIVTVPDIRGLRTHGATGEEAAAMGEEAIAVWLSADKRIGHASPSPRFTALDDTIYEPEAVAASARS